MASFRWEDGAYYDAKPTCMGWTNSSQKKSLQFAIEVMVDIDEDSKKPEEEREKIPMTKFYHVDPTNKISMDILFDAVRACGIDPTTTKSREWANKFDPNSEVRIKIGYEEYDGKDTAKIFRASTRVKAAALQDFSIRQNAVENQPQLEQMQDTLDALFQQSGQAFGRDSGGGGAVSGGKAPATPETPRQRQAREVQEAQRRAAESKGGEQVPGPELDDGMDGIPF